MHRPMATPKRRREKRLDTFGNGLTCPQPISEVSLASPIADNRSQAGFFSFLRALNAISRAWQPS
jgi:hypothetical protein